MTDKKTLLSGQSGNMAFVFHFFNSPFDRTGFATFAPPNRTL